MKNTVLATILAATTFGATTTASAADAVPLSKFYEGYAVEEIPADAFQQWPYYTYASAHIEDFLRYGVHKLPASANPVQVERVGGFNISPELRKDLIDTQVKAFVVMKDGKVLAEHFDNGFKVGMLNNLQSAAKTYVGVLLSHAVDSGKIALDEKAKTYLPELEGSIIGEATISEIATMNSGIEPLSDYHTPGSNGYEWEKEIGLQNAGEPIGHLNAIKAAKATPNERGTNWDYTDQNSDTLALIVAKVEGKPFEQLLADLHNSYGGNNEIQIAKTSDGTTSPAYGINISAYDYALFTGYIAQGKAGSSFYKELKDPSNDVLNVTPGVKDVFGAASPTTYDMQSYTMLDEKIIYSHGSFGQTGFSDTKSGYSVIYLSDWYTNTDVPSLQKQLINAVDVINELRAK
ncbi:serine hydrolase domain-containing protein [Vibrio tapetis subsp. quintayensis]|uniref:serine hydrolase domain-containing protein n=1 Tax=Vibrio tapetis TaxID=52443 RepID=UPI0025B3891C|nr:serine hydrolase domain-containing protein [Vibrio tapetis]MDN3680889.1 serine hydrolase domain-containing protein [Vibrio tapetis subsp. quintayensis]